MKNVPVDEARAHMLGVLGRLPAERVGLDEALGRTLAEDVMALRDQPPFDPSAMDGWAVRAADAVVGARLTRVGESAAGAAFHGVVREGQTVRIFTGAPIPQGADAVVIQENTRRDGEAVVIDEAPAPGANIRRQGGDFEAGDILLQAGARLDPWRISLAAAAGRADLLVARRPSVAILSTGEELVPVGSEPGPEQIFNSGGPALAALVRQWGGQARVLTPAGDNVDVIAAAVKDAACDVLVTIGGASVGDHDLVKPALSTLGLTLVFESLKMRPGKPTSFGVLTDGRYVLGLPGNPSSAMACAELFLKPLLAELQGADASLGLLTAVLAAPVPANSAREHWMRASLTFENGVLKATPMGDQDSSLVTIFAKADALLRRLPDAPAASTGDVVQVLKLERL